MNTNEKIIIDLKEYSKNKMKPPKGQKYRFKVKKDIYVVEVESMTGREICELAELLPPENFKLNMKVHSGEFREVGIDEVVSFTEPGIEKFTYISRDPIEG